MRNFVEGRLAKGMIVLTISGCASRVPAPPPPLAAEAEDAMDRFVAFALEPARLPPPSIADDPVRAASGPVVGEAHLVRAEEADWNSWPGEELRLFNHRWAWVIEVSIEGPGVLEWLPDDTTLELNEPDLRLAAAPHADDVLGDLLFWALQSERADRGESLTTRLRAAGPFRGAYLPLRGDGALAGVVAFPAAETSDLHVVAARLTVPVRAAGRVHELVFTLD